MEAAEGIQIIHPTGSAQENRATGAGPGPEVKVHSVVDDAPEVRIQGEGISYSIDDY